MDFAVPSWLALTVAVVIAAVLAFVIAAIASVPMRLIARRKKWDSDPTQHLRMPFRVLLLVVLLWVAVGVAFPRAGDAAERGSERWWYAIVNHGFRIATIAAAAWLIARVVAFLFDQTLNRYPLDAEDNRVARRIHTQLTILRRLAVVIIVVLAVGSILLTFPGVQAVGASILASAGLASVVAGLAAQSTLANVFAGLQLAFSDAIRVDDVVIADGQWGLIEEITLTYVVVRIWDDRRLVLPSTYFTTTPFENWTRRDSALLGAVELDLDWHISPERMRASLDELLDGNPLWDGRTKVLQVTEATGGFVRVRILASAKDAGTLFDLRCAIREHFVEWLGGQTPEALPRTRIQSVEAPPRARRPAKGTKTAPVEGLFSGSAEGEQRAAAYTTSIPLPPVDPDDAGREAKGDITDDEPHKTQPPQRR